MIWYADSMAKVIDPQDLPTRTVRLPGMKPPVREFAPADDGDPAEVDAFQAMIRQLRAQSPAVHRGENEPSPSRH
jgi:hypothetical protein